MPSTYYICNVFQSSGSVSRFLPLLQQFQSPGSTQSLTGCRFNACANCRISIPRLHAEPDQAFPGSARYASISIPRLHAEPDVNRWIPSCSMMISIHRLHAEPDSNTSLLLDVLEISIHRLHAEPDSVLWWCALLDYYFNPQAPRRARPLRTHY